MCIVYVSLDEKAYYEVCGGNHFLTQFSPFKYSKWVHDLDHLPLSVLANSARDIVPIKDKIIHNILII